MSSPKKTKVKKRARAGQGATVRQGRRTNAERAAGQWRITVREIQERSGDYTWTTYLVQGWKDERGKWARKKFKDRAQAEAFAGMKRLATLTRGDVVRPIATRMTPAQVKEAETALDRLAALAAESAGVAAVPSLLDAVAVFEAHWRAKVAVDATPFRDARRAIVIEREQTGRGRSAADYDMRLRAFERWLLTRERYTDLALDPDLSPPVHEVKAEDVRDYLASIRTKEQMKARAKTRNNLRADLHAFFEFCMGRRRGKPVPGVARRWCSSNPAAEIPRVAVTRTEPQILSLDESRALMRYVEGFREGAFVPFYALAMFAGLRPGRDGEISKLAVHPGLWKPCKEGSGRPLIDLERGVLTVPAAVAKTGRRRIVTIQPNLAAWLRAYPLPVMPVGADTGFRKIRKECALGHDVARHAFISYFIGLTGSKARAALEAGNSEGVIDSHYLHLPREAEGREYFAICPEVKRAKGKKKTVPPPPL